MGRWGGRGRGLCIPEYKRAGSTHPTGMHPSFISAPISPDFLDSDFS